MDVFSMHLMPWPYLPADYTGPSWVRVPNQLFDPKLGHELYNRYLDELELAETLGLDGVVVNEHHATAYGLMPSPNLIAGMLARRTERIRLAVIGNALPLYNPPTRVAEELALLDVVSGGRLTAGLIVGSGPEYVTSGINPVEARRRFNEALDLVIRAWTEPGPFEFHSEFYDLPVVNPWPRPIQQPHPPIVIPGVGSLETMEMVADRGFSYIGIPFFHMSIFNRNYGLFRKTWLASGRAPDPSKLGFMSPICVAETDAEARKLFEEHIWYFAHRLLDGVQLTPPGYMSARSAAAMQAAVGTFMNSVQSWDDLIEGGYVIIGSPERVTEQLTETMTRLGAGFLYGVFQLGTAPHELVRANMELFASEVMPKLKANLGDGPKWEEA